MTLDGEVERRPQGFAGLGAAVRAAQCRTEVGQRTGPAPGGPRSAESTCWPPREQGEPGGHRRGPEPAARSVMPSARGTPSRRACSSSWSASRLGVAGLVERMQCQRGVGPPGDYPGMAGATGGERLIRCPGSRRQPRRSGPGRRAAGRGCPAAASGSPVRWRGRGSRPPAQLAALDQCPHQEREAVAAGQAQTLLAVDVVGQSGVGFGIGQVAAAVGEAGADGRRSRTGRSSRCAGRRRSRRSRCARPRRAGRWT